MRFGITEQGHAKRYLADGLEVICHPWPTDAPNPWPAVVRNGVRRGREIPATKTLFDQALVASASRSDQDVLQPGLARGRVHTLGLDVRYPLVGHRPQLGRLLGDAVPRCQKETGLRNILPRWERRGVSPEDRRRLVRIYRYRPSVFRLLVVAPASEVVRRAARRR